MGGIRRVTNERILRKNRIVTRNWTLKTLKKRLKFYEERVIYDNIMIKLISEEIDKRKKINDRKKSVVRKRVKN